MTCTSPKPAWEAKNVWFWLPTVHKNCIYSKKSTFWCQKSTKPAYTQQKQKMIVKSHQTCIYSKKSKKKQKLIHLCQSVPHRVWNFCFFCFFWVYAGLVTFPYQNFCFFWVYAGLRDLKFTKPAYTQKNQHFDAKSAQSLHILKKIKKMIIKSHQTCIYSKKSKKSKTNSSMPVSPT